MAGLRASLDVDIKKAFNGVLSDAVKTFTIVSEVDPVYDPATGNYTATSTSTGAWRGVFDSSKEQEIEDQKNTPFTVMITALQSESPFNPSVDDSITQGTNEYRVVKVASDPADVTYNIYCNEK